MRPEQRPAAKKARPLYIRVSGGLGKGFKGANSKLRQKEAKKRKKQPKNTKFDPREVDRTGSTREVLAAANQGGQMQKR